MIILIITTILLFTTTVVFFLPYIKTRIQAGKFYQLYHAQGTPLEVIYITKSGVKFYGWKSLFDMKQNRAQHAKIAALMADLCMTPDMHAKYLNDIRLAANAKNWTGVLGKINELEQRTTWAAEPETLRRLAHVFSLMEGEDPGQPQEHFFEKKLQIWKEDSDCEAFFLNMAFGVVRSLELLSETDLVNYLRAKEAEVALSKV